MRIRTRRFQTVRFSTRLIRSEGRSTVASHSGRPGPITTDCSAPAARYGSNSSANSLCDCGKPDAPQPDPLLESGHGTVSPAQFSAKQKKTQKRALAQFGSLALRPIDDESEPPFQEPAHRGEQAFGTTAFYPTEIVKNNCFCAGGYWQLVFKPTMRLM